MDPRTPITVAISCFEDLLALGLEAALAEDPALSVVARNIAPSRISVMLRAHDPRVLIFDVRALRDPAQVRELVDTHPDTRLVLLGDRLSSAESAQLLAFGASACLARDTQARDLRNAIHLASRGLQLQPMPVGPAAAHTMESLLTAREGEVLGLLRQDRSNAEIALTLQIGVETVRSHARKIYRKLGVTSRRSLLALSEPAAAPPARAAGSPPARRRAATPARARRSRR